MKGIGTDNQNLIIVTIKASNHVWLSTWLLRELYSVLFWFVFHWHKMFFFPQKKLLSQNWSVNSVSRSYNSGSWFSWCMHSKCFLANNDQNAFLQQLNIVPSSHLLFLFDHKIKTSLEPSPSSTGKIQLKSWWRKGYKPVYATGQVAGEAGWKFSGKG